ncbi:MFS multidrug transporter, putative [Cordyceps militaris CM01]|uniref:MFS multidrug transporter, putative n=1 Tax=Cordyceps militaris (strain CM01) TaxID=983644 RepID=G3JCD2_CORMM|nr:MFS multidrug transporter, putative [Cordyceps militaris CM01]EGX93797.1 MFS multidrug transporter, putative [Cordyceps militaris CM01]
MLGAENRPRRAFPAWHDHGKDTEESPLLLPTSPSDAARSSGTASPRPRAAPTHLTVTLAASALILILDVVASVPMTPRLVIFEQIICRTHYRAWGRDDAMGDCKVAPVQAELALVNGWKETFDTVPGILVSIPYGILADHIGRTNVLMLALFGTLLSECWIAIVCWLPQTLPLRSLWLSGAFQLIGGGGATMTSMCYTMIADMCAPEQSIGALAATLIVVVLSFGRFLPSSPAKYQSIPDNDTESNVNDGTDTHINSENGSATSSLDHRQKPAVSKRTRGFGPWLSKDVFLMLIAFFCCQLSRQFSSVLLQFSSFKFHWDYAKASYLLPLRAGINLVVLFYVVPKLLRYLTCKRGLVQWKADKYVTFISSVCLTIGSILIFLSSHPLGAVIGQSFIALGFTFTVTARSLLTAMVEPRYVSLLYTSVTSVTYAGLVVGGPVFAAAFQWGLKIGGIWIGMPFLVTTALFLIITVIVYVVRVN